MMDLILKKLTDPNFVAGVLAAIAVGATVVTVVTPFVETDTLGRRMKQVSSERERIRAREREKLAKSGKGSLRPEAKAFMSRIVDGFNVSKWLGTETAKTQLAMAGYRGQGAEVTFLFFRLIMPLLCGLVVMAYLFVLADFAWSTGMKIAICIGGAYLGIKAPEIFLSNTISKRQKSIRQAFPDTLDLLADLCGIGHVARACGAQGQPGDRHTVGSHGRGAYIDHGRDVVPAR